MKDSNSGVNTILLTVILVIIVGGLVWVYANFDQTPVEDTDAGLEVDVGLPQNSTNE